MATGFFGPVPYKRDPYLSGARYCAMDDFTEEIRKGGGQWEETEQDGDVAIVYTRAPTGLLRSIGLVHTELSETEARSQWTPTRKVPRYNSTTGLIEFLPGERHPCKPISALVQRVPSGAASLEVVALLGLWGAVGFGQGFRLPTALCQWLAEHGIAPGGLWFEVLMRALFDQYGAFPTTPVLDDFNRSNQNPIAGNWSGPWIGTEDELQLLSNELVPDAAPGSSYWNVETFGPDAEVHCLIATKQSQSGFIALAARLTNIGDGTTDGYSGANNARAATDTWRYDRVDNGAFTKLGADEDSEFASGDSMGFEIIGSTLTLYHKTSGTWSALATRTDSTYTAAGSIGVRVVATTDQTMDDFGGGDVFNIVLRRRREAA